VLGKDHVTFGLTSAVILNSVVHVTAHPPLSTLRSPTPGVAVALADMLVFYSAAAFGALLPDIDECHSIIGHLCGFVSKAIQHFVGHRKFFHSLIGLVPWALLSLGLYFLATTLLAQHGLFLPAAAVGACQIAFEGLLFGCVTHLIADGLTVEGVPLLWPSPVHYGFPLRIRTGHLSEHIVVYTLLTAAALLQVLFFRLALEPLEVIVYAVLALVGVLLLSAHR
jgi:inner membrane protein